MFSGWKPSTSFAGSTIDKTVFSLIWAGKGNCTKIPSTSGSALSSLTIQNYVSGRCADQQKIFEKFSVNTKKYQLI